MTESNGSPVTRAELAAHIKGIDQRFQDVAADVAEIKWGIHGLTEAATRSSFFGIRGRQFFDTALVAVVAALVSGAIAIFIH